MDRETALAVLPEQIQALSTLNGLLIGLLRDKGVFSAEETKLLFDAADALASDETTGAAGRLLSTVALVARSARLDRDDDAS
jgi:hypothetical protein